MGHTPGPWTIAWEDDDGDLFDNGVRIDAPEGPVAFNVIDCSAALIAAAPELLAALKLLRDPDGDGEWTCYCDDPHFEGGMCENCVATAAIAKAEGEE